MTTKPIQPRV